MVKIVYETPSGIKEEKRVEGLKYLEQSDCWSYYPYGKDDSDGFHTARRIPRERVYYIEEQEGLQRP